jgi:hypothetical protein
MAINDKLKEKGSLERKRDALKKNMDSAQARGNDAEYKRYKREYDAIVRSLTK